MTFTIRPIDRERAPLLARAYLDAHEPSALAGVLAHVPELLEATMPFVAAVYGPTALAERLKEIVILRVSARNGCRYCVRAHRAAALDATLDERDVASLIDDASPPASFDEREAALVVFADAMCDRPAAAAAPLAPHYRDHEIVEFALLASATILLNRFCTAMGLA